MEKRTSLFCESMNYKIGEYLLELKPSFPPSFFRDNAASWKMLINIKQFRCETIFSPGKKCLKICIVLYI